jgi:methyl-accepting chemotaxis protein
MDHELIAYLDRRFREASQQISEEISSLRQDTTQQIASLRDETIQRFEQVDGRLQEVDGRLQEVDGRLQELKETGHQTLILVEDLRGQIQMVAEGVAGANQRLDAFKDDTREEIKAIRGRVQILEAKAARPRRSTARPS